MKHAKEIRENQILKVLSDKGKEITFGHKNIIFPIFNGTKLFVWEGEWKEVDVNTIEESYIYEKWDVVKKNLEKSGLMDRNGNIMNGASVSITHENHHKFVIEDKTGVIIFTIDFESKDDMYKKIEEMYENCPR